MIKTKKYSPPKILAILFIIFIAIFSLDAFKIPFDWIAFIVHLLPVLLLVVTLIVAWKNETAGGVVFIILGMIYLMGTWGIAPVFLYLLISILAIIIGILLMIEGSCRERQK